MKAMFDAIDAMPRDAFYGVVGAVLVALGVFDRIAGPQ